MKDSDQRRQRARSNRRKGWRSFDLSVFKVNDEDSDARRKRTARPRKVVSRKDPPVVARIYNVEAPFQSRYIKAGVRRRFDVPLKAAGAEIRLPSLPAIRLGARWISLLLLVTLAGMVYFLWNSPTFQVSEAKVSGAKRIKSSEINAAMGITGQPVFALHPGQLEQQLQNKFPEFLAVDVKVDLPDKVSVKVTERVPVMTWHMGDQTLLIDTNGMAFPLRLGSTQVVSPVVEASGLPPAIAGFTIDLTSQIVNEIQEKGKEDSKASENKDSEAVVGAPEQYKAQQFLTPEMVAAVLALTKIAPADRPLLFDPGHGLGWKDDRGWQVYVGNALDVSMKLNVYDAIVQRLLRDGVQPSLISVEYVHNPYIHLR